MNFRSLLVIESTVASSPLGTYDDGMLWERLSVMVILPQSRALYSVVLTWHMPPPACML